MERGDAAQEIYSAAERIQRRLVVVFVRPPENRLLRANIQSDMMVSEEILDIGGRIAHECHTLAIRLLQEETRSDALLCFHLTAYHVDPIMLGHHQFGHFV